MRRLVDLCKQYSRIDYDDDDSTLLPLMIEATIQSMKEKIPQFDPQKMTSRQTLLLVITVKDLYDHREKYGGHADKLRAAAAGMMLSEKFETRRNGDA